MCGGDEVHLIALVSNPSAAPVQATAHTAIFDPHHQWYEHLDTRHVDVPPGPSEISGVWIPFKWVNGTIGYEFELSWPGGTVTDRMNFTITFDSSCAQ